MDCTDYLDYLDYILSMLWPLFILRPNPTTTKHCSNGTTISPLIPPLPSCQFCQSCQLIIYLSGQQTTDNKNKLSAPAPGQTWKLGLESPLVAIDRRWSPLVAVGLYGSLLARPYHCAYPISAGISTQTNEQFNWSCLLQLLPITPRVYTYYGIAKKPTLSYSLSLSLYGNNGNVCCCRHCFRA